MVVFLYSGGLFSQNIDLPIPNSANINKLDEENQYKYETCYYYLIDNFKTKTDKLDKIYFEWNNENICSFKQKFEKEITYYVWQCKEAGGIFVTIEFPDLQTQKLMVWIEQIYSVFKTDGDEYIWKENNTRFEPKDSNPGCYFKLRKSENKNIVELYCGC